MKIGIIGAGFTGLSAAHQLSKKGHIVTVFEKDTKPGGLAIGYQEKDWQWTLEHHYHHWFSNDSFSLNLAKELNYPVVIKTPHTNVFIQDTIYELDSIKAFLTFPKLDIFSRVRHLFVLGLLFKINPFWKPLERFKATRVLPRLIGKKAYQLIWEPQLQNKLGEYMDEISLVWFWARIHKRTPNLAYPQGGFLSFADHITKTLTQGGVHFYFNTGVINIEQKEKIVHIKTENAGRIKTHTFDRVIVTLPSFLFTQITPGLPKEYTDSLGKLKGIGATNLVLRLKKSFLPKNTYWLSICKTHAPIMAIIEHTHFMDKKFYNNEHIVYLGNYVSAKSPTYSLSKEELLKKYDPFLKKINPDYKKNLIDHHLFKAPFAQPIVPVNYSKILPSFYTPFSQVYLANMEQVYPWDRGTNYAIELGNSIANIVHMSQ